MVVANTVRRCSPRTESISPSPQSSVCSRRPPPVDTGHCGMDTPTRPIETGSPLLTDEEACNYLRIRQRQLYAWRMQGVIPFIRIGRSIRYRLRDLDSAVEARTVTVPSQVPCEQQIKEGEAAQ